jgi:hypothetical protein
MHRGLLLFERLLPVHPEATGNHNPEMFALLKTP